MGIIPDRNWIDDNEHLQHSPLVDTRGEWKQVHYKNTFHRTVEGVLKDLNHAVQKWAQNKQEWFAFIAALHTRQHNGHE